VTARVPAHVGGADPVRVGGVPAFPQCYDAQLIRNAVVIACQHEALVWRGEGDASSLGDGALAAVADRTVATFVPAGLRVSDLDAGARTVAFDAATAGEPRVALARGGGVAFVDALDGALALFSDWRGQLALVRARLPAVAHVSHDGAITGYVRGDGARSVWLHHDGYDEQLSPASDPERATAAVHARAGFVAYERRTSADGPSELVRRDPSGKEQRLLACAAGCFVEALGDDGTVSLVDEATARRLVAPPGAPAAVVSSSQGHARWGGAGMLVFLGRDVFRVGGPAPEEIAAATAAGVADVAAPATPAADDAPSGAERGAVAGGCSAAPTALEASRATTATWLLLLVIGATLASRRRP
jgi:hypothetical protein